MKSLVILLAAFAFCGLFAEENLPPAREILSQEVEKLDSNNFDEREKATRVLMQNGPQAVELLKQALKAERSAEFVLRANRIVRFFEDGGAVVNGMKVVLSTNKTVIKQGESITLTTRLTNMTDTPLKVCIGYSVDNEEHNEFVEGATLRSLLWVEDWGRSGPGVVELLPKMVADPFHGSIKETPPLYVVIPAKGVQTFSTPIAFSREPGRKGDALYQRLAEYSLGEHRMLALPVTPKGTHRLRMSLNWDLKDHEHSGGAPAEIQPKAGEFKVWSGGVASNEIEIKVAE